MNKLIRYINQNRKEIKVLLAIIIFVFAIIRVLNYLSIKSNENQIKTIAEMGNVYNNTETIRSVVSNKDVTSKTSISQKDIIEKFIQYCNNGNVSNAYGLLSQNCKDKLFPSVKYFEQNYYNLIFLDKKSYTIQNWTGSTYRVDFEQDLLSTGGKSSETIQDFITVESQDDDYKLNINSYIGRTIINKETNIDNVNLKATYKDTFMDYEEYQIEVYNGSENDILLDNLDSTNTMYATDKNNVKYAAYSHELAVSQLTVNKKTKSIINIKYNNSYVSGRIIEKLTFSNVIIQVNNKQDYLKYEITF